MAKATKRNAKMAWDALRREPELLAEIDKLKADFFGEPTRPELLAEIDKLRAMWDAEPVIDMDEVNREISARDDKLQRQAEALKNMKGVIHTVSRKEEALKKQLATAQQELAQHATKTDQAIEQITRLTEALKVERDTFKARAERLQEKLDRRWWHRFLTD